MGFFRDAIAAGRESIEGPQRERAAVLAAEIAMAPPAEVFLVALGAVYRNIFLVELRFAETESRPPAYLYLPALPTAQVEGIGRYLERDFEVTDVATAAASLATLEERLDESSDVDEAALWITRASWLAIACAGVGMVDAAQAYSWTEPFALSARSLYDGWDDFGHRFLAGERRSPASNLLGRRSLRRSVEALRSTGGSPWRELAWPLPAGE